MRTAVPADPTSAWIVPEEAAVRRVVDVGLHDGRIQSHLPAGDHALLARHLHDAGVELLDQLGAERLPEPHHRLRIRHGLASDPGDVAVDQVGPHLPLQGRVAPGLQVLEHEEPEDHLRRGALPPAGPALRMAVAEGVLHQRDQRFVVEEGIDRAQPLLPEERLLVRDQRPVNPLVDGALLVPENEHRAVLVFGVPCQRRRSASRLATASSTATVQNRSQAALASRASATWSGATYRERLFPAASRNVRYVCGPCRRLGSV